MIFSNGNPLAHLVGRPIQLTMSGLVSQENEKRWPNAKQVSGRDDRIFEVQKRAVFVL